MAVIQHPQLGAVNYEAFLLPDDADEQCEAMTGLMAKYAVEDSTTPQVTALAQQLQGATPVETVARVWAHVRGYIRFVNDEVTAQPFNDFLDPATPVVETLVRPVDMIALDPAQRDGDCDDYSMLTACLLLACGIPCAFVTIAADPSDPTRYSHVYVAAYPAGGGRIAVDSSHGPYPGWEAQGTGKLKEWPVRDGGLGITGLLVSAVVGYGLWKWWGKGGGRQMAQTLGFGHKGA